MTMLRQLQVADLDDVVAVHRAAFPGFLMTLLGPDFLHSYYRTVLDCEDAIFLGLFDDAGRLQGFVAGFATPASFYAMLAKRKRRMLVAAAFHLLRRPVLWSRVLENAGATSQRAAEDAPGVAELASIAVLPGAQGKGYGRALIEAFLSTARPLGAARVDLTTDADGNDAVNRLYTKAGFRLSAVRTRRGGRRMNHYTMSLAGEPDPNHQGEA